MAQDVFSKMAEEQWILNEDGYLNIDTDVKEIIYHPYLNVILICTHTGVVRVLDVNSGVILHSSSLSAQNLSDVKCKYIPSLDRVLFTDGQALGVRSDYNGVLLLDSILQKNINDSKEEVQIELPLSEAIILKESLISSNIHGVDEIINELTQLTSDAQKHHKKGIKAQKWNTVCLTVPLEDLRYATSTIVSNLLTKKQHIPELGVASAVQERLSDLLGEKVNASDRKSMASEWRRRETYSQWPHMDYRWALPDQMAQAGFYHQPNTSGDDRAMCFTCSVCLVSWERTDEPCSEHERHSPNCPFVVGEYTQNVPLSVTYATCAAVDATYGGQCIRVLGHSSVVNYIPAANNDGLVSVFDVTGKVRRDYCFYVTQFDSFILDKYTQDFGQSGGWLGTDIKKHPVEKKIGAVCIVGDNKSNDSKPARPSIICGLTLTSQSNNDTRIISQPTTDYSSNTRLYLVVYDFTYNKELEDQEILQCNNTVKETIYVPLEDFEKKDSFSDFLDNLDPTMSSYYKSFLPGESDEVFLPPSLTLKKNHTGPKVLVFDDFSKVPISDSSLPPSKAKHLFNGPMSCAESEASISDHIAEVKNSKSSKKLNYSRAVQCVSIPEFCKSCQDLEISDIIPTHDQNHLLICLKGSKTSESFLVIYQLDFSEKMVKLKEEHVLLKQLAANEKPLEINLLPVIDKFGIVPDKCCEAEGNAIMVCEDGVVRIVSLSDLNIICYAKIEDDGFVSAAFCNSLDRLCASTKNGSLHFYVLNNAENESSDDHEDDDPFGMNVDSANALSQSLDNLDSTEIMKCFQKPPDTIPLNDLKTLKFYCDFEPLKTGYCVVVPPCWSEFQQSLRQRRQPQCDGEQSSKTWRLLTDTTTWDEHIFEITLPGATVLGHVDVHFTLQPSSTLPNVEITLLRQNKNGIGHKRDVKFAVDETVTIDMLQWVDNPVTSQEYLRAHNADILAGPIDLASHLDLTEQSGIVTLTSPKLYKTKVRNLLLHIRAVNAKDDGKSKAKKNTDRFSTINTDKFGLPPLKTDIYMGCDVIHELSLTLHTVKHPENSKERAQRSLMLESGIFVESLLLTAVTSINNDEIGLVLDTLDWIASIRLSRNRSNNGEAPNQQLEFLGMIEERLEVLLYQCLLLGGRSVAHKAVRLIITCCSGSENISPSCGDHFNSSVLKALTSILDSITEIKSASGLQWMFSLLLKVTAKNKESMIATKCTALLSNVANELLKRSNPYHLVLRGRYGLYGTPMEPELFDVEPPPYIKGDRSSTYMLPSNPTQQEQTPSVISTSNYSFNKDSISPKDILSTSTTKLKYKNVASLRIIRGLIETQPLHFTCIWSSEGTRVERADSNINSAFLNNVPIAFSSVSSDPLGEESVEKVMDKIKVIKDEVKEKPGYNKWVIEMLQDSGYLEHKGISDIVFINPKMSVQEKPLEMPNKSMHIPESNEPARLPGNGLPWQELLTIPPKQVIVVERMQSGARRHITLDFGKPVLLTDVFIPFCADLVTLTIDIWLKGEDVDETRLVVAMDIGTRNLLLTDLQPPPLCRYMKITVVGRYGMSTVRCRIPLGYFYGHITVMSDETSPEIPQSSNTTSTPDLDKQLGILSKLFEDINCRYSLACSKLKELLQPFIVADMKNAAHLATYMNILKDRNTNSNNAEHTKIVGAYQESIKYQYQLNIIKNVMTRIEGISNVKNNKSSEISTDKLASIAESLLEVLLSIDATTEMSKEECQQFFKGLCMTQHSRLQLLGAMFLEKHCGKSLFWGDFLADTLAENFATSCIQRFPQDRLFILLSYLSRKSSEKSSCIDAALRILHDTLTPLITNRRPLLAATVDLPLISWELMYLSLQLSLCKTSSSSINRWNWVLGEMVGTKNVDNSKGNNRKKTCKRMVQVSSNTLPSYSSIVVNSDNSYQQKMKSMSVHDKLTRLKCIKKIQDEVRLAKEKKEQPVEKQHPLLKMPQNINSNHCLVVAKGLLQLILSMDHSSSADMLLLCFKVISKLVILAKLQLGQLLKENQLLDLIHFCISSKIPWAPFALACFLQDVMELSSVKIEDIEMETETVSSPSWIQNDAATEVDNSEDNFNVDTLVAETSNIQSKSNSLLNSYKEHLDVEAVVEALLPKKSSTPIPMLNNANFPPLPSVFESEDSDFDELLGDSQKIKTTSKVSKQITASNSGLSCAMDMRLELGVQSNSEITLKKLLIRNTHLLIQNVSLETSQKESYNELNHWPTALENLQPESSLNNQKLLTFCFASLFENIHNHDPSKIEHILQLWLTLNSSNKYEQFAPGAIPQIVLNCSSINYLISAMAWTPGLSLTTWCSALQTLTLVCNTNNGKKWFDLSGMAHTIVTHVNFVQFFLNLLSGTGPVFNGKILAGPLLCKALHDFLVRLQIRCDVVSPTSKLGNLLKSTLLKVTYQLTRPSGSVACRLGPLDAQCKLLQTMLYLDFANSDLSIAMSTLESTAALVHSYVINSERVKCISIGEKQAVMTSTFSDIFASVLGSDSNKQDRPVSYEDLLILLLKLLGKLVQTPLPNQQEAMDTESAATSQTDESKAEQINQENSRIQQQIPCFADIVLQHHPTVIRLCRCLAACKSSSLCMLANVSQKVAFSTLSEPNTVGDAIFHLLALLARKASNKDLLLRPLLIFLSQAPQLSEPLLWFILQVLDTEEAIEKFFDAGGITILGNSIVNSTTSPSTLSKVGTISTVMQHFSSINNTPDVRSIISSASSSKKVMQTSIENKMALVNFAPYCTISCESSTAQSADVLIQGSAGCTHRRARAPLWSYHFYPEENHTELMLQLPNAVLLREVQLQPHSANLATSPSYVALEVSANGPSRLSPVCLPLPTSGLTFIRLHLPVPKVVNCVLIRLYKPHDANSIGLIYIRLLGNYAFGGSLMQGSDAEDESHCKHSLGWLRLLHHCFTLGSSTEVKRQIIESASAVPNLLTTCCGLLLVPSHILPVYLPCLEKVLRELVLHSSENSYQTIKVLLDSRSDIEPLMVADASWQDRLINISGYQSACELLYQICEHQDDDTPYRIKIILEWLETTINEAILIQNTNNCNAAYFSSIASILWTAKQTQVQYDLTSLISLDLFNAIYTLKTQSKSSISLKYSLDSLLCSLCYIMPDLFPILLEKIGVLVPNLSTGHQASISDDRKDSEGLTDDNKRVFETTTEWYGHLIIGDLSNLNLTSEQLETIALVSRSPTSIQQLLDSGLPKLLNSAILEFCHSENESAIPMAKLENVSSILQFFTDISDEKMMRDWLGSEDGSSFWLHLLKWLCKSPNSKISSLQTEARVHLEEVCVKFLSKCCLCHSTNQARLSKVLCDVIYMQPNGISGFMRRLILQLLLENEKIPVNIEADETLYKSSKLIQSYIPAHPAFKQTYNRAMLCLSTNTTLLEILEQHIFFKISYKSELSLNKKNNYTTKRDIFKSWFAAEEQEMSMAAGVTAKDKRAKDAKNQSTATPQSKKKRYTSNSTNATDVIEGRIIKCETYSDQPLPLTVNLGQLLRLIESKGNTTDWPYIHLKIYQCKNNDEKCNNEANSSVFQQPPICSALQVFSSMGGLALLAQHLPTVYPEAIRSAILEKSPPDSSDSEWIKVDESDDVYEDILEDAIGTNSPSKSSVIISHVPPHSLTAFGLFLRLPGYAEVLLKDMKKALYLLRLTLGVTDDGEGGDIFNSPISDSLPTLPFEVLKKLYDSTPLSTDDGRLLRRISINIGVVHLLLACIGIFSHQSNNGNDKDNLNVKLKEDKSQLYWAKGTGFGTGSTQQSWNVEQALLKQKSEEEHVTVLLQVLASYINPNDDADDELTENVLPRAFYELLTQSALLPAISSYLRNDSVLDMARHIPLYRAVLLLLRAIAVSSQLVSLLLPQKNKNSEPSISSLLKNMKSCVDTYASKLRLNTKSKSKNKLGEQLEELDQGEGLATLMPDIQNTANLVSRVTSGLAESDFAYDNENSIDKKVVASMDEQYLRIMKNLQFSSYEMITELPEGGIKFVVSHHFENNAKTTSEQSHPTRVKRIAQEAVTLSTSLPLSYSSSVFVRYDNSRLDVMKVLITGPADTPYANGCFELDVFFPPDYPLSPMMINLETTGHHTVRFNPNLYNDGKVCLSVLNTWHGRPEEKWNAQTSSFLQVLVSIQSLILVPEPYFNEPGYERARGTPAGTVSSRDYNLNICQATVRWAMLEQILNPCPCFKEIIQAHFYIKRFEIIAQVEKWISEVEQEVTKEKKSRTNKKSPASTLESFKKVYQQLREALVKLRPPPDLEEDEDDLPSTPTNNMEVTIDVHQVDNMEKDMMKMVNDMCE
ncbi:baculoviral IAP repeat-containing protein 6 isoform X1 [Diorhabda carinulata]|uniref:baculoviral IAP repeat-containing protein 6 isoform X1 n=1 Tax=Diorhabda carinulata TaxID=1163345 RepID=UPI0025A019BD|nr:baculoviral IAP repeat-containing protein 6 isoform X1 [Diorhabda carinulata]